MYAKCPAGHYTHHFVACGDALKYCYNGLQTSLCAASGDSFSPTFTCVNQLDHVPYTFVCDYRSDCSDNSDEEFCRFPKCQINQTLCDNEQCIELTKVCDGWRDCYTGDEESDCKHVLKNTDAFPPPAIVTISDTGTHVIKELNITGSSPELKMCPETHFQCQNLYCLPVLFRCNGIKDCGRGEDEGECDSCPGFYRCRDSNVCLHHSNLCDGFPHCFKNDDELLCDSACPSGCLCRGYAFFCKRSFTALSYPHLRFLDAGGSDMTVANLDGITMLIHLNLSHCGIAQLGGLCLPNLISLHIQDNQLRTISDVNLVGLQQLRELSLAGNPLDFVFRSSEKSRSFCQVRSLDLSRVDMPILNVSIISDTFPELQILNLSHSRLTSVRGDGFGVMVTLHEIDLRGCPMTLFPRGLFQGLENIQQIHAQNFRICCPAVLPTEFNLRNCFAPMDVISSCEDLLRRVIYKVCVCVLCLVALVGNVVSFIFRSFVFKRKKNLGHGNFVTHLSVSDGLMGVYLGVIAITDQVYHGKYVWNDAAWKHSVTCQFAGCLSLLSSEVSAFVMCLITLDRFLVLRFPFSQFHFKSMSAHAASGFVWMLGIFLVSVPLLPENVHWEFYSLTNICIPLPFSESSSAGHHYSFGILIILNFIVFIIISMGQLIIYWSVSVNSMTTSHTTKKTKDLAIARRLISVAMTDFLCWFPIGILGLLAARGVHIPGEVNVAVAVFVLPLNSAVNPCLYTINVIMERRSNVRFEKLRALLLAKLKADS